MDRVRTEVVAVIDARAATQQELDALQGPALDGQAERRVAVDVFVGNHLELVAY